MSKIKAKPTNKSQEIKPIDCKITDGMTRIYGVRKEEQTFSIKKFEQLIIQL